MLEKLRQIENRYSELESKLADPAYYSDPAVFTKLCREQRELQPVVETYRAYTACQAQIAQAEALLSDPELHEIAREEIDLGRARCAELEQQLRVLLLPRDPNDDRNVILEIRTGVGGEESAGGRPRLPTSTRRSSAACARRVCSSADRGRTPA